jgi:hypothetical protein
VFGFTDSWLEIWQTGDMKKLLVLLLVSSLALAHQPLFNAGSPSKEQAFEIVSPEISKVITAESRTGSRNWYALKVEDGFNLDLALFVGAPCPKAFVPRLYLVSAAEKGTAPFNLPNGYGALANNNTWSDWSGHGVVARKTPTLEKRLKAGTHYLVVEHGQSKGWYFLSLGGSEIPGGTSEGRAALARFNRCS